MGTKFRKNGNTFSPIDDENLILSDTLPVGNYTVKQDQFENFYFESVDSFEVSHRLYGDTVRNAERMIRTFNDRPAATGVLLTGEKGSGKTLLAKMLSVKCAEIGIPTIIINTAWCGDKFNTLIQSIQQPCMILFDEFEKTYDRDEQTAILTLLDGVFPSKKLFVLTCNDQWRIDEHMRNRPGRIYYALDFRGLDVDFITEYCSDNLKDLTQTDSVCRVSTMFSEFNFDMLKALVEEMNRYGESARDAIKLLNAKPQTDDGGQYNVSLTINGVAIPEDALDDSWMNGNPLKRESFQIGFDGSMVTVDDTASPTCRPIDTSGDTQYHFFTHLHLKKIDPVAGSFVYDNTKGAVVTFTRIRTGRIEYAF